MTAAEGLIERFRSAAVGMVSWTSALDALGAVTQARIRQLAALDDQNMMVFNILSNVSNEEVEDYFACGGPDPARNPRTRAQMEGPVMRCMIDEDFMTPERMANSAIYNGLFARYDVRHACMVRLSATEGARPALTLLRPRSAGAATGDHRRLIEAVAPAVAGALGTALLLGRTMDQVTLNTAERLAGSAMLHGPGMRITSLSPGAEQQLRAGTHLTMRGGRLVAADRAGAVLLDRAIAAVSAPGAGGRKNVTIMLPPAGGIGTAKAAELCPLPVRSAGPLSLATAILVLRAPRCKAGTETIIAATYGLTPAETAVAMMLAEGLSLPAIADRRHSSVNTVRNQVKSLFDKTDTRRQAELALKIRNHS